MISKIVACCKVGHSGHEKCQPMLICATYHQRSSTTVVDDLRYHCVSRVY